MKYNVNDKPNATDFFNEIFDCKKMKSLVADREPQNFSERFRNWLREQTTNTRERVWVDVESYQAG